MLTSSKIIDRDSHEGSLWISSIAFANKTDHILNNNIEAICSVCQHIPHSISTLKHLQNLHLYMNDQEDQIMNDYHTNKLHQMFQEAFTFIQNNRKKQRNVLVHCIAGMSRSAAIVIYYLMKKQNISFQKAHNMVKARRPIIKLNNGFIYYLSSIGKQTAKL